MLGNHSKYFLTCNPPTSLGKRGCIGVLSGENNRSSGNICLICHNEKGNSLRNVTLCRKMYINQPQIMRNFLRQGDNCQAALPDYPKYHACLPVNHKSV